MRSQVKSPSHIYRALTYLLACLLLFSNTNISAKEIILIKKTQGENVKHKYTQEILVTALNSTIKSHGEYEIKAVLKLSQPHTVQAMIREKHGDIIQGATREEWENQLLPIKIPILKGMLGLRVLFINQNKQPMFDKIDTLIQLKQHLGGAGTFWSITKIFEHHNFNLVLLDRQISMYSMLEKQRFDYISRGLHEALIEYDQLKSKFPNLHIENNLLLHIPLPAYFFVNPNKPQLAKRLEAGLKNIINNGVLDKIFAKHFKAKLHRLKLFERKFFELKNPYLSSPYHEYRADELKQLLQVN